jgi:beta-phosphoglucomutase-like phosphatase (HAD superfamily)
MRSSRWICPGREKPSPEPFLLGMKKLGVTAKEMMLVGDSILRDIVPAKGLGMLAVHAIYGDRNFHEGESDGAAACGSLLRHQVFSFYGVAEFVHSLVYGSPGLADLHGEALFN